MICVTVGWGSEEGGHWRSPAVSKTQRRERGGSRLRRKDRTKAFVPLRIDAPHRLRPARQRRVLIGIASPEFSLCCLLPEAIASSICVVETPSALANGIYVKATIRICFGRSGIEIGT